MASKRSVPSKASETPSAGKGKLTSVRSAGVTPLSKVDAPGTVTPNQPSKTLDPFSIAYEGFERSLFLGSFADAGRAPRITDVEVAVCFADLRGFTNYVHSLQKVGQDNRVQHFLREYFTIYPRAVLNAVWQLEPKDDKEPTAKIKEIRSLVVPTTYKNLGDGMMIVWELQNASDMVVQGNAARVIFQIAMFMRDYFANLTSDFGPVEMDAYSRYATDLKLGIGLAKGHAWRLEFGRQMPVDYAGSIVNLAARLQTLARPEGIVAQLGFSESLFVDLTNQQKGVIRSIPSPKGLGQEPIDIWHSTTVQLPNP